MVEEPRLPGPTYDFEEQLKLLHEGKFADFEIHCEENIFQVHRFVICSQSNYFKALAGGEFKEAADRVTTFMGDSALLARYLIYLYSESYPESNVSLLQSGSQFRKLNDTHAVQNNHLDACTLHAQMYCFAKRLCDDRLEKFALQEFSRNYWTKKPRQKIDKHNMELRGPTRTLKYHLGLYVTGMEETLIVGNKNTHAEIHDLLSDFSDWSDISITSRRIRNPGADPLPIYHAARRRSHRSDAWKDNPQPLTDFDFDNTHLVIGRSTNSHAKNLSLLSSIDRWSSRKMSAKEQDFIRFILKETTEFGTTLKEMISLDLTMRKSSASLIPDQPYRTLQLEFPDFFLSIDSLIKPDERRQCQTCSSIQPVLRQACSCGKWSDACENDCLSKQLDELKCFRCLGVGKMKVLEERGGSTGSGSRGLLGAAGHGLMFPYDYLVGDELDY